MSKKTRKKTGKKSSKPALAKAAFGASSKPAKKPPAKTKAATAKKSGAKASQKRSSNPLKSGREKVIPPAKGKPKTVAKSGLAEGMKAPGFNLPRDGGTTVSLGDYAGKRLVLFFYPRADTPGCTREAIDFTRLAGAFAASQTAILGVSADPPKAQEAFRNKHELSTPLASDENHAMLEAYGAWGEKSMYGRTFLGVLRTTVLIGVDGRVARIWRHVKVDGHADEVLAAIRGG